MLSPARLTGLLLLTTAAAAQNTSQKDDSACPDPVTDPALDTVRIQQVVNRFPLSIDNHDYQSLRGIFAPDAFADFGSPGSEALQGVDAIIGALSGALADVTSQHDMLTSVVTLTGPATANATTYLVGNFFGRGNQTGQKFSNWGSYVDTLTRDATAGWRIQTRRQIPKFTMGDETILYPSS